MKTDNEMIQEINELKANNPATYSCQKQCEICEASHSDSIIVTIKRDRTGNYPVLTFVCNECEKMILTD